MSSQATAAVIAAVVSVMVTTVLISATLPWLRRHAVDLPNGRSSHATPIPRGAGLSVILGASCGVVAAHLATRTSFTTESTVCGFSVLAVTALGLVDDVRSLASRVRLGVQLVLAGTVAVAFAVSFDPSLVDMIFVAVAIVAFVNAFNFMDGVNGISGLVSAVIASWLAICGWWWSADASVVIAAVALAAGSVGFLPWNLFRARVFLGDSGSYGLGFSLSALAAWCWLSGVPLVVAGAPLLIYVADVLLALVVKTRHGLSWDAPHRLHVYQRLTDAGWSHPQVAGVVAASVLLAGLTGVVMTQLLVVGGLLLTVTLLGYLQLPRVASRLSLPPS